MDNKSEYINVLKYIDTKLETFRRYYFFIRLFENILNKENSINTLIDIKNIVNNRFNLRFIGNITEREKIIYLSNTIIGFLIDDSVIYSYNLINYDVNSKFTQYCLNLLSDSIYDIKALNKLLLNPQCFKNQNKEIAKLNKKLSFALISSVYEKYLMSKLNFPIVGIENKTKDSTQIVYTDKTNPDPDILKVIVPCLFMIINKDLLKIISDRIKKVNNIPFYDIEDYENKNLKSFILFYVSQSSINFTPLNDYLLDKINNQERKDYLNSLINKLDFYKVYAAYDYSLLNHFTFKELKDYLYA